MLKRASSSSSGKSSTSRRSSSVGFDEFGFALSKKRVRKLQHRCHDYSYPQPNPVKVKELCEFLTYWNGSSFICRNQIERFIRIGIPPAIRGRVWKCLLNIDSLRAASSFDYEACQAEIRRPLVDLGVSEYSIISTIDSLVDTENEISSGQSDLPSADLTLFKQIALDLRRSFPTHRTLMGDRPEAIEGQAKLFRVLTAFARYNPQIGYVQGMSYIAAVLLMILSEEEAFWALVALLEKPKYLSELFDSSMKKIQLQALVFHQLLKHRKPLLFQHLETLGVSSLHFIMQWFLTLFTSLPCWDSVLAIWDLIMLHGLQAVFRTGLTIILLLESRIMNMTEEAAVLPVLLRVPMDVSQHRVLIPALWNTDVQEWEINCMNSLVLEEASGGHDEEKVKKDSAKGCTSSLSDGQRDVKPSQKGAKNTSKKEAPGSGAKNVFTRLLKVAQHYLLESGKYSTAAKSSPAKKSPALSRLPKARISTSFAQAQVRTKRSSSRRSQNSILGGVKKERLPSQDSDEGATEDSSNSSVRRVRSGPVGKVARRRSRGQSRRGTSLLLKNRSSRSQQTSEQPENSKNEDCQETQSRNASTRRPLLNERNFITCPMTASQVRESQLI
ncbi:TBC1 domain family member 10B [Rhinichthys klamathensis goyatoka]|uniref:TBC1 domain family member 10B n=1 Tax=Rhinichthys klamathensis goyatoka TaxID=3034132 RepID=UPI0024B5AD9A|nr:TBC1 domain family member 10B [Rhinichthys klamathensis goyatoka]